MMLRSMIDKQAESSEFLKRFHASAITAGVNTCLNCGLVATRRCTCKRAHYCGIACQQADWKRHKLVHRTSLKSGI